MTSSSSRWPSTKVWLESLNDEPFHHLPVVVFSTATETELMVVPEPEFDEAVPVILPDVATGTDVRAVRRVGDRHASGRVVT